jgi:hypothetical protein
VRRFAAVLAVVCSALAGAAAAVAADADECRGLQTCIPVQGPWVAIPAPVGTGAAVVEYQLACPVKRYVVGGVDARVSDPGIAVGWAAHIGSPVSPGVTTGENALFTATYAGAEVRTTAFRPYIGCLPSGGGGGQSRVSWRPGVSGRALAGAQPPAEDATTRAVVTVKLPAGATRTVFAGCPPGGHVIHAAHTVSFRTEEPPSESVLRSVRARRRVTGGGVQVTANAPAGLSAGIKVEVQVIAVCAKGGAFQ